MLTGSANLSSGSESSRTGTDRNGQPCVASPEILTNWFHWAYGIVRANLGQWALMAAVTGLLTALRTRIWEGLLRATGRDTPEHPMPAQTWPPDDLARVYNAEDLKSGLVVAPGTRLVLVDGGIRQCTLGAGTYKAKEVERLLRRYAIRKSGLALQYSTMPLEVHAAINSLPKSTTTMRADVVLDVRIEDARAEKVLDWVPLRDGVADVADVQRIIQDKVGPWLHEKLAPMMLSSVPIGSALASELEPFLNEQVFAPHGLVASVRSVLPQRV